MKKTTRRSQVGPPKKRRAGIIREETTTVVVKGPGAERFAGFLPGGLNHREQTYADAADYCRDLLETEGEGEPLSLASYAAKTLEALERARKLREGGDIEAACYLSWQAGRYFEKITTSHNDYYTTRGIEVVRAQTKAKEAPRKATLKQRILESVKRLPRDTPKHKRVEWIAQDAHASKDYTREILKKIGFI